MGVILAMSIGVVLETFLHFFTQVKLIGYRLNTWEMLKIVIAGFMMGYLGKWIFAELSQLSTVGQTCWSVAGAAFLYCFLLVLFKVIRRRDIARIPMIGQKVAFLFPR